MNAWKEFPMFLGSILALVALAAGLLQNVEPTQCLIRAGVCYLVGSFSGSLWNIFFASPSRNSTPQSTQQSHQDLQPEEPQESSEAA